MIGRALLFALLAAAMPAAAQTAPDWPQFRNAAGIAIAVDRASIQADGNRRTFRGRLSKEGDNRSAILGMVADCQAQTLAVAPQAELYVDGKLVHTKQGTGAVLESRSVKDDEQGLAVLAYVCKL